MSQDGLDRSPRTRLMVRARAEPRPGGTMGQKPWALMATSGQSWALTSSNTDARASTRLI